MFSFKGDLHEAGQAEAPPRGLENLELVEEDRPEPGPGEVRIRANSLNFHDDMVAHGKIPVADGRVPLSDGAGDVVAIGDGVDGLKSVIDSSFPLQDIAAAFKHYESQKHFGKVCLEF